MSDTASPAPSRIPSLLTGLLILTGLFCAGRLIKKYSQDYPWPANFDLVSIYDQRLAEARRSLPPGTRLGYLAENEDKALHEAIGKRYTQYSAVPLVVGDDDAGEYLLGNFPSGSPPAEIAANASLQLIQAEPKSGIYLYRRLMPGRRGEE